MSCEYCRAFLHLPGCPYYVPTYQYCAGCGEKLSKEKPKYLLRTPYCSDCYEEALLEKADLYFDDYIAENEMDYYRSWFESEYLNDEQRLEAYKAAYALREPFDGAELQRDRETFCFERDDFLDYLKGRIENG